MNIYGDCNDSIVKINHISLHLSLVCLNFVKPEFVRFSLYVKIEGILTVCTGCTYTFSGIWMKVYKKYQCPGYKYMYQVILYTSNFIV